MADDYGTLAGIQGYLPQVADDDLLEELLTAASRMLDRLLKLPTGFFDVAGASATEKEFLGNGLSFLTLPPMHSALAATGAVTIEDVTDTVTYQLRQGRYLHRTNASEDFLWGDVEDSGLRKRRTKATWPEDKVVTVTARWGWSATPEDVINATYELAGVIYRQNPERQLSLDTGDEQIKEAAIPLRCRLLENEYAIWREVDSLN